MLQLNSATKIAKHSIKNKNLPVFREMNCIMSEVSQSVFPFLAWHNQTDESSLGDIYGYWERKQVPSQVLFPLPSAFSLGNLFPSFIYSFTLDQTSVNKWIHSSISIVLVTVSCSCKPASSFRSPNHCGRLLKAHSTWQLHGHLCSPFTLLIFTFFPLKSRV
jgi:hypothetical protein